MNWESLNKGRESYNSVKFLANSDMVDPPEVIREAEDVIFRRLRTPEMRLSLDFLSGEDSRIGIVEGDTYIDIDPDWEFLDPIYLKLISQTEGNVFDSEVVNTSIEELRLIRQDGNLVKAPPSQYCVLDGKIMFDTQSDRSYTAILDYFGTKGHRLAPDNPETFLTKRHSDLMRIVLTGIGMAHREDYSMNDHVSHMAVVETMLNKINSEGANILRGAYDNTRGPRYGDY